MGWFTGLKILATIILFFCVCGPNPMKLGSWTTRRVSLCSNVLISLEPVSIIKEG